VTAPVAVRGRSAPLTVRTASADDAEAIALLRVALLREESGHDRHHRLRPDVARRARQLTRRQLADPSQVFFVAVRRGGPVGILRCRVLHRTPLMAEAAQGEVTTAYVLPGERRRGVLRALLVAAEAWCRERGLPAMRLHCGRGNANAQAAWQALGFEPAEIVFHRAIPGR
jgi:GNAT superfamily N-acetyltransferase